VHTKFLNSIPKNTRIMMYIAHYSCFEIYSSGFRKQDHFCRQV
jgi:hypothetical protein